MPLAATAQQQRQLMQEWRGVQSGALQTLQAPYSLWRSVGTAMCKPMQQVSFVRLHGQQ